MKKQLVASLFAALAASASLCAQKVGCPDMDIRVVKPSYEMAKSGDKCGVGLTLTWKGIEISTEASFCPLFVLFTPGHAEPVYRQDSKTFVRMGSTYAVTRVDYQCEGGFLFFSRGSCRGHGPYNVGAVTDYQVIACDDLVMIEGS